MSEQKDDMTGKMAAAPIVSPYLLLILPPLFWAGNAVVGRFAMGQMPPMSLSFSRWSLALLLLLPFGVPVLRTHWAEVRRAWKAIAVMGVLSVTAYNSLLYIALQTTEAINATLVNSSMPMVIIILSATILGERIGLRQGLGIVISLIGVVAVITHGQPALLLDLQLREGDLLMLVAVTCWALFSVLLRHRPVHLPSIGFLTLQIAFGLAGIAPFFLFEATTTGLPELNQTTGLVILYTALFPAIVAFLAWNVGVKAVGANIAGQYIYLIPLFTAVLAGIFLGERLMLHHGVGAALIFGGIWLATKSRKPKAA